MSRWAKPEFSKKEVNRAGKLLVAGPISKSWLRKEPTALTRWRLPER